MRWTTVLIAAGTLVGAACSQKTGALTPSEQQRIDSEGVVRRADDLIFRYTHDVGRRDAGWEDRKASIIVTKQSVIIHKNEKLGLELTPRTRRFVQVRRDGDRIRISAGAVGRRRAGRSCRRMTRLGGRTTFGRWSSSRRSRTGEAAEK